MGYNLVIYSQNMHQSHQVRGINHKKINIIMKSEQEIKEYLSTHFFADAIHARGIRAVLRDKFKESATDFEFKITFDKSVEYKEITDNLITFNDAKKYIWDEKI